MQLPACHFCLLCRYATRRLDDLCAPEMAKNGIRSHSVSFVGNLRVVLYCLLEFLLIFLVGWSQPMVETFIIIKFSL